MRDWAKEIRAAIAPLNLESMHETELVEELSQHLRDRYDEMLAGGTDPKAACHLLLRELNDGALLSELRTKPDGSRASAIAIGQRRECRNFSQGSGTTCASARAAAAERIRGSRAVATPDSRAGDRREYDHLSTAGCSALAHSACEDPQQLARVQHSRQPALLRRRSLLPRRHTSPAACGIAYASQQQGSPELLLGLRVAGRRPLARAARPATQTP